MSYCSLSFGQRNSIHQQIEQARNSGEVFVNLTGIFTQAMPNNKALRNFNKTDDVHFFNYNSDLLKVKKQYISIEIPNNNKTIIVDLIAVPDSFYDYKLTTERGEKLKSNRENLHYRGMVRGDINSLIALSFFEDGMMGICSIENKTYNFSKIADTKNYIMFNENDLAKLTSFNCQTGDTGFVEYSSNVLNSDNINDASNKCLQVYYETNYDLYQNLGNNISSVENFVTGMFNQMALIYQNEDITTSISEIFIWSSEDNYSLGTLSGLSSFVSNRPSFNGDVGQLLTYREDYTDESPYLHILAGGVANGIGGVCVDGNSELSGHSHTQLYPDYESFPVYSRQLTVMTHEIGHNLGSRHTHACVWNGNNTAIDSCADGTEGNCSPPGYPSEGGTIMSYCDRQLVGIDFALGFGLQPGNVIRDKVLNATCIEECYGCLPDIIITDNVSTGDIDYQQAELTITATNSVESGAEALYHAGEEVLLTPDFDALNGSVFRAYIEGCTDNFEKAAESISNDINRGGNAEKIIAQSQLLKIYPNPSKDSFTIDSSQMNEIKSLSIFDLYGRLVTQHSDLKNIKTIDATNWPSGVYICQIQLLNETITKKIIKH